MLLEWAIHSVQTGNVVVLGGAESFIASGRLSALFLLKSFAYPPHVNSAIEWTSESGSGGMNHYAIPPHCAEITVP